MNNISLEDIYCFQPEKKLQGFFELVELGLHLPITVVNGKKEGSCILITAGIHGGEYTSIQALQRLSEVLNPHEVIGKVVILPVVNMSSFYERSAFVTPEDKKNLNRCFPGDREGSYSEVLAYHLTNNFIAKCDFYIDCHGGDIPEKLLPHLYYSKLYTNNQEMSMVTKMANLVNVPVKIVSSATGGSYQAAMEMNIPSILLERGCSGLVEEDDVLLYQNDLVNILRGLGILSGVAIKHKPKLVEKVDYIYASYDACWNPKLKVGQYVKAGDLMGVFYNCLGESIEEVRATKSGMVLYYNFSYAINNQDLICAIAIVDNE